MQRNISIDLIKFFAIFFVVAIHTAPFQNIYIGALNGSNVNFVINTFARFAVPFFFTVSGYLVGKKVDEDHFAINYLKKYLMNLLGIYLGWSFFYILYDFFLIYNQGLDLKVEIIKFVLSKVGFHALMNTGISSQHAYQMWYLIALIYSVLILSIFIKIRKTKFLLFLSFILNILGIFCIDQSYSKFFSLEIFGYNPSARNAIFLGLFYTTLGYCFAKYFKAKNTNIKPRIYLFLFFVFSFVQLIERFILVHFFDAPIGDYFLTTIPITICLFLFALTNRTINESIFSRMGANSIGIFVTHTFIISIFKDFILEKFLIQNSFVWQVIFTPLTVTVSFGVFLFLQNFKGNLIKLLTYREKVSINK